MEIKEYPLKHPSFCSCYIAILSILVLAFVELLALHGDGEMGIQGIKVYGGEQLGRGWGQWS